MNDEFYEKLKKIADNKNNLSEKEMGEKVHKLIQEEIMDSRVISMGKNMDKALKMLEKATNAKDSIKAKKYAEEAYKICPDCFDAVLYLASNEDNPFNALKILSDGLENEKKRLKKIKKYGPIDYDDYLDYITKAPYLNGLLTKIIFLTSLGRLNKAKECCLESLMIDEYDEAGIHFILMSIYACLENDEELLNLSKEYPEETIESLFPLLVLAYKQENDYLAISYMKKLYKINNKFFNYFEDDLDEDFEMSEDNLDAGMQLIIYMEAHTFLLDSAPGIDAYIIENKSKVIK